MRWRALYTIGPFYLLFLLFPWVWLCMHLDAGPGLAILLALAMASVAVAVVVAFAPYLLDRPVFAVLAPFVAGAAVAIPILIRQGRTPTPVASITAVGVSVTLLSFLIGFYNPSRYSRFMRVAFFLVFLACAMYFIDEWFIEPDSSRRSPAPRLGSALLLLVVGFPALLVVFARRRLRR